MNETATYIKLKNKPKDNFPSWLIVHHSAASELQTVQSIENYHLSLGWEGVGYQYLITNTGQVWLGRPEHYHGAHVSEQSMNTKSIGICLIGNFDVTMPTQAQIDALKSLLKSKMTQYNIQPSQVVPHRHFATYKSCYGNLLANDWVLNILSSSSSEVDILKKKLEDIKNIIES